MKTATEASKELNCSIATVTRWAKALSLGKKYGYAHMLSDADIAKIRKHWKPNRGCKPK
jgi:hypothetical protein